MTMAETKTFVANAPVWVDLASADADKARDYCSKLFGWKVEVAPDPDAGGYALAKLNGKDVAGIGPARLPMGRPRGWSTSERTTPTRSPRRSKPPEAKWSRRP